MEEGLTGRAAEMAESVLRIAAARGVPEAGWPPLAGALTLALGHRRVRLADEHDPALLHPARTALLLLRDAEVLEPALLTAGILLETRRPELATPREAWRDRVDAPVRALLDDAPRPDDPDLAEALVIRAPGACRVSLAEHLDHLRHLHVESGPGTLPADARRRWEEVEAVWLPVAERTDPTMARRYRHWLRAFGRRLERHEGAGTGGAGGRSDGFSTEDAEGPATG